MTFRNPLGAVILAFLLAGTVPCYSDLVWDNQHVDVTTKPGQREATVVYHFRNSGTAPVTITDLRPSCHCTVASVEFNTIAPGAKGEVTATVRLAGMTGLQQKEIAVFTDNSPVATSTLSLTLEIKEPLQFSTKIVTWHLGDPLLEKAVILSPGEGLEMTGVLINDISPMEAAVRSERLSAGNGIRLQIAPNSTSKASTVAVEGKARMRSGEEYPFTVFANVR